jgi:hypothetical protein
MARVARVALPIFAVLLLADVAADAETVRIVAERTEVRQQADAGASVLGTAGKGTVLQVLGREDGWVRVAYPLSNGAFYGGYVPAVFCEDARGAAPSTTAPVVATAPPVSDSLSPAPAPARTAPPVVASPTHRPVAQDDRSQPSARSVPAGDTTAPAPVSVFVRGAAEGGFLAPGVSDSVSDLKSSLRGRRGIQLTEDEAKAEIVVTVVARIKDFRGESYTNASASGNMAYAKTTPKKSAVVTAQIRVGDYSLDLVGEAGGVGKLGLGAWGHAAGQLADQVEAFVKENGARLIARRSQTP